MNPYEETFQSWEKVAKEYEEKFMNLDIYNACYDAFIQAISKSNAKILELGCGPGNISNYILSQRSEFNILLTDASSEMLKLAKKNIPNATFKKLDVRKLDKLEDVFDGIIIGFVIPYLDKNALKKLIRDSKNIITEHGSIYISFLSGKYEDSRFISGKSGNRMFVYFHSEQDIESLLEHHGFSNMEWKHVAYEEDLIHSIVIATQ